MTQEFTELVQWIHGKDSTSTTKTLDEAAVVPVVLSDLGQGRGRG
eukprot:CAMPEP_0202918488 /NCGR_PEP_ID=MMETSP1392-20130828/73569_1 /ASSEMBLY_ACC=CAM_ASM_000868 /TAXON_ID=225041 /ORGANISM="Chlamydomonas chlamydogama, Strain SAG 11-48b" /LENGTH=44 /DNA_ID= /DNA_START= /DNA_END= /DNA_ORIENTATION=